MFKSFSILPQIMSVDSYIKDLEIGKTLDPMAAVKSLNFNSILSNATQLENFLLLNTDSRDVSMFFINTVDELIEAEALAKELGLGFKSRPSFIPDSKGGYHIFLRGFTFTNEEKSKELDSLHPTRSPSNEIEANYRFRPILHFGLTSWVTFFSPSWDPVNCGHNTDGFFYSILYFFFTCFSIISNLSSSMAPIS